MNPMPPPPPPAFMGKQMDAPWYTWFTRLFQFVTQDLATFYAALDGPAITGAATYDGYPLSNTVVGSFYDTTTQTAASAVTAYLITLNSTGFSAGVSKDVATSSKFSPATAGYYEITAMLQFSNSDVAVQDVDVWIRKNGTDVAYTNNALTVHAKHGAINGSAIYTVTWALQMNVGDYVQLYWDSSSANCKLTSIAAGGAPVSPAAPSVEVLVKKL